MEFDELQKAWNSQSSGATVTLDADALLKVVRRNQQSFRATIFWRDAREIGVAFFLTIYFSYRGVQHHHWTDCLVGLACLFVGMFMIVDRLMQWRKRPAPGDSLKNCIESSLHQVNHQIWLLRNIFWWYLLPIVITLTISSGVSALNSHHGAIIAMFSFVFATLVCGLVYGGVYWLNQYAVRKSLEPRRLELETLLNSLK
jgi:hypothetical protein